MKTLNFDHVHYLLGLTEIIIDRKYESYKSIITSEDILEQMNTELEQELEMVNNELEKLNLCINIDTKANFENGTAEITSKLAQKENKPDVLIETKKYILDIFDTDESSVDKLLNSPYSLALFIGFTLYKPKNGIDVEEVLKMIKCYTEEQKNIKTSEPKTEDSLKEYKMSEYDTVKHIYKLQQLDQIYGVHVGCCLLLISVLRPNITDDISSYKDFIRVFDFKNAIDTLNTVNYFIVEAAKYHNSKFTMDDKILTIYNYYGINSYDDTKIKHSDEEVTKMMRNVKPNITVNDITDTRLQMISDMEHLIIEYYAGVWDVNIEDAKSRLKLLGKS